jgi:hypothetical protein
MVVISPAKAVVMIPSCCRSAVTDMEEKVQYQSEERLRDVQVNRFLVIFKIFLYTFFSRKGKSMSSD